MLTNVAAGNSSQLTNYLNALVHRYAFNEYGGLVVADSITPAGNGILPSGGTLSGGQLALSSGSSQYVKLPAGIMQGLTNFTIALWVNLLSNATWNRLFDFGINQTTNMFLTAQAGSGMQFAILTNSGSAQLITYAATPSTNAWHQVVITLSGSTGVMYLDGAPVGTNASMTINPSVMGVWVNNFLGKSEYADPYLNGSIDEFQIYNRGLSAMEITALNAAGPPNYLGGNMAIPAVNSPSNGNALRYTNVPPYYYWGN
jgi:hypothetical protein